MRRGVLAFVVSVSAFTVGCWTCFVQSDNFAEGARLQELQVEVEWFERRISGLRSEISRFEFEAATRDNKERNTFDSDTVQHEGRIKPAATVVGGGVQ